MNQLKAGVLLNYTTIILTAIVGLMLTPFIINRLGDAEYGLYILIGAFVGYLTLLDFGLNNTIIRFVSKYRAQKDKVGEEQFLGTIFIIYAVISLAIIIMGTILYLNIEYIFANSLTSEELEKAKTMFIILVFNLSISLPGGAFTGISAGYEKFIFPKAANIIKYLLRSVMLVGILYLDADAVGIVILDTIMNILLISVNAYYVIRVLKVRIKLHSINRKLLKEIFGYSMWIFIIAIAQQFQWNIGQLVLGIFTNTKIVAIYAIGIMLGGMYGAFGAAISGVFLPKATQFVIAERTPVELTDMMIRIGRISLIVLLYILGEFVLYGEEFILLWVGDNYIDAWFVSLLIMLVLTFIFIHSFAVSILEAKKLLSFRALFHLGSLVIGTYIGVLLVDTYSINGMIVGITAAMFIYQIIMSMYYKRKLHLEINRFYIGVFKGILISFLFILVVGYLINYIGGISWLFFIFKAILFTITYVIVMYYFGLNLYEKQLFSNLLKGR